MVKKRFFKTKDECEVAFELATEAGRVELVCEANGWEPITMKRAKKAGPFRTRLRLPKEKSFQFRYLVDRESWLNDEAADAYIANGFGGENGVLSTAPEGPQQGA